MKSYINQLTDYRTVPIEKEVVIPSPKEHIQKELRQLTRKNKYTVPVDCIQKGDVAFLKLTSELPRYQKNMLPLTVGSGLFDQELEGQLLGHKAGDCFSATVENQPVEVEILKASRTCYPEPTDEMAAAYAAEHEEFAKAVTVAAYCKQVTEEYYRRQREDAIGNAMQTIIDAVLTTSDWEFDDEEIRDFAEKVMKEETENAEKDEGKKLRDMTPEEFKRCTGFDSMEEMKAFWLDNSEVWIATTLWCAHENGKEPSLGDPEVMSYRFLEDYVRNSITFKEE